MTNSVSDHWLGGRGAFLCHFVFLSLMSLWLSLRYEFCPFCHSVFYSFVFVFLCFFCLYLSFCLKMIIFAESMYNTFLYSARRM